MHYLIVVGGEPSDLYYIKAAFAGFPGHHTVMSLDSGPDLLHWLEERSFVEFPFLVIINHPLQGVSGLELVTTIKNTRRLKLLPVTLMSLITHEADIRSFYFAGANCFYRKPSDQSEWNHLADCLVTLFAQM